MHLKSIRNIMFTIIDHGLRISAPTRRSKSSIVGADLTLADISFQGRAVDRKKGLS